jgi:hypothetical protein
MPTTFPSSASKGHPLSTVRVSAREEPRRTTTDRPRPSFFRRPAKGAVFRKTRMPFTDTVPRRREMDRSIPSLPGPVPRSRRPHFVPRVGTVFDWTLQAPRCGHPRFVASRGERLFHLLDCSRPGLTTQACQRGSTGTAVDGVLIAPLAPLPVAAP